MKTIADAARLTAMLRNLLKEKLAERDRLRAENKRLVAKRDRLLEELREAENREEGAAMDGMTSRSVH